MEFMSASWQEHENTVHFLEEKSNAVGFVLFYEWVIILLEPQWKQFCITFGRNHRSMFCNKYLLRYFVKNNSFLSKAKSQKILYLRYNNYVDSVNARG